MAKREYKSLTNEEKLNSIKEDLISRAEYVAYSKYIVALENNDVETINFFESFGDYTRQIISNYRCYHKSLEFGFECSSYSEYGWLERPTFLEKEEIMIYVHKNGWKNQNSIEVAKGINGKWTNGIYAQTNTGGEVDGISVWGEIHDTKESAIVGACKRVINYQERNNWDACNKVIYLANELIEKTLGRRPVQLSLF
ncbi:hypothetical protein [uncultured Flavobacterium sp.]|uniref:hypothetical protein n=1 Tax=uncultured Flavobacterium sp. TaxID=165435 RepID=UPI0025920CAB|nr:hypothetical protein [uncultured Flavobacterium sp.]